MPSDAAADASSEAEQMHAAERANVGRYAARRRGDGRVMRVFISFFIVVVAVASASAR
jgi:hypothetical protein